MKIRVWSDLHADGAAMRFAQNCHDEVLVLAGDTANSLAALKLIVSDLSSKFKHIVIVLGNHEFYHGDEYSTFSKEFKKAMSSHKNVHLLDKEHIMIEDIIFIGATLWSNFDNGNPYVEIDAKRCINDFRLMYVDHTQKVTPAWMMNKHKEELEFIRHSCKRLNGKKVVVTHFPPLRDFQHPRWGSIKQNPLNAYFMSDLTHEIEDLDFDLWICGHTHDGSEFEKFGKKFICNPRGYCYRGNTENTLFNINKVVEL